MALTMYHEQTFAIKLALPLIRLIKGDKVCLKDIKLGDKLDYERMDFFISEEMTEEDWKDYYYEGRIFSKQRHLPHLNTV